MEKFTNLNNKNKKVETSDNRKDFIKNLVNETLSVQDGEIKGKDILISAINKIMDLNESKTTIKILENVKAISAHTFNFNLINEAIQSEKIRMEQINNDTVEVELPSTEAELISESKKCDECKPECDCEDDKIIDGDDDDKIEKKKKDDEYEEEEETEVVEKVENIVEKVDTMVYMSGYDNPLMDIDRLTTIMNAINGNVNEEHHLDTKEERIGFILEMMGKDDGKKVIMDYISELPSYIKTSDIEQTINELSDKEVEELYKKLEK